MPSDKKLVAAAAHTRQQAELFWAAVENAEEKLDRALEAVEAAKAALARAQDKAEERQAEADEAAEAASGIPVNVNAEPAQIGVNS